MNIENGEFSCSNQNQFLSECQLICDETFEAKNKLIKCQQNGEWSNLETAECGELLNK